MNGQPSQNGGARTPPHASEAEQAVLGGLLLDNAAWDRVVDRLVPEDFYFSENRVLFEAIGQLASKDKPFDCLTTIDALKQSDQLERAGGEARIFDVVNQTPTASHIEAYADIVRERSVLRALVGAGQYIADLAFRRDGESYQTLIDQAETRLFNIAEQRQTGAGPEAVSHVLARTTEQIDRLYHAGDVVTGLSTGYRDLDEMTTGLQKGDMVIVAGRPSMGKTSFAMNLAEHAAIDGQQAVLVFSMEMPSESLVMRMLSSIGRVNQQRLRTGKLTDADWPRLTSAISMMSEANLFIDDTPALSPAELRARARRVGRQAKGGLGLIVIDYLQLMQVPSHRENRTAEISEISRQIKALAKEMNVPIIALSQLNRGLEQRQDKRPVMSDLRESGAIEQDADVIAFIYRDEVYNAETSDRGVAEIILGKQRNGPIGKVRLTFLGEYTRFENFAPEAVMLGDM